jgi:hypothetical protein
MKTSANPKTGECMRMSLSLQYRRRRKVPFLRRYFVGNNQPLPLIGVLQRTHSTIAAQDRTSTSSPVQGSDNPNFIGQVSGA